MNKEIPYKNSFASHPKSKFWSNKNKIKPTQITKSGKQKIWFDCYECYHSFESTPDSIIYNQSWCPYCSIPCKKLCEDKECVFCFENSFASQPSSKFWSNKNKLNPNQVIKNSGKKYLFNCNKCNHEFDKIICNNTWCPYCKNIKLCENEDCKECYKKSFASSDKAKYLKNENPRTIFKTSNKNFNFNCNKCNHSFTKCISTINNGSWCPFCSGHKICFEENCKKCFNKSFESHPKSIYWSSKNELIPRQVFKSAAKMCWFDCNKCNHNFKCTLNHITNGTWCSYCSGNSICNEENCKECFNKSFASSSKSKFWSNKNQEIPRNIFKSSTKKFLFDCNKCNNEFESALLNISNGRWCPQCKFKTELKLLEWLKEIYPNVKTQVTFNWSQKKRYDFFIEELKLIIELDGKQHFEQVSNWQSPEKNQINDTLKNKLANENGYRMIRICQQIVLEDLEDWQFQLKESINKDNHLLNIGSIYFINYN
jgi:very-short-patch-repair endonuclease